MQIEAIRAPRRAAVCSAVTMSSLIGIVGWRIPGTMMVAACASCCRSQVTRRSYAPAFTSRDSPQTRTVYGSVTPGTTT